MADEEERELRARIEALERERDALARNLAEAVAELEGRDAAFEAASARLDRELAEARREALEARVASRRLEAARREAADARAEATAARRELERARAEAPLRDVVQSEAARLGAASDRLPVLGERGWRFRRGRPVLKIDETMARRLRKLRRDPEQFFEDSKAPLARRIGRLLFK